MHSVRLSTPPPPLALLTFFFFNDTATTEIYTLSLHDALPILLSLDNAYSEEELRDWERRVHELSGRSEEHTSELQSRVDLVCRLLLEKKKMAVEAQFVDPYVVTDD